MKPAMIRNKILEAGTEEKQKRDKQEKHFRN